MQDEDKLDVSSGDSSSTAEVAALPSGDEELGQGNDIPRSENRSRRSIVNCFLSKGFYSDYNLTEVTYVICAACLIALNTGFINGVTMSGYLITLDEPPRCPTNPKGMMIAGFAGAYTENAIALIESDWEKYTTLLCLIISYMCGAFIAAMINPHAKEYIIEPRYGLTFMVGGTMLLVAGLLAYYELPSRFVFFLASASNGVQNGIASIYSANLIRCTLTGATTDIAIVIAQCIHGNYKGLARGSVLGAIVFFFWFGGLIGFLAVKKWKARTLFINAILFYLIGIILIYYLVKEYSISVYDAFLGTWKWKKVLKKLHTGDGNLTQETLMDVFDMIDAEGDRNGSIDADELRYGLRRAKVQMTKFQTRTLLRAADDNGDGVIDRTEWLELAKKIL